MSCFSDYFKNENGVVFGGEATQMFNSIDECFKQWALSNGAEEYRIPALIDGSILEKCGYFETFPQHLTALATFDASYIENNKNNHNDSSDFCFHDKYLTPAACIHIYPTLKGGDFSKGKTITTLARVYRYEEGKFEDLTRIWDFTVREIVFIGSNEYVQQSLKDCSKFAVECIEKLCIPYQLNEACDYFYPTTKNRLKQRVQLANAKKQELVTSINDKEVAIASFNQHDFHFSLPFDFSNNGQIVTGCVGFGLERWMAALEHYNVPQNRVSSILN